MCTEVQNLSKCTLLLPTSVVYMNIRIDQGEKLTLVSVYIKPTETNCAEHRTTTSLFKCCGRAVLYEVLWESKLLLNLVRCVVHVDSL